MRTLVCAGSYEHTYECVYQRNIHSVQKLQKRTRCMKNHVTKAFSTAYFSGNSEGNIYCVCVIISHNMHYVYLYEVRGKIKYNYFYLN